MEGFDKKKVKRDYVQTNIYEAINNLRALSESRIKKQEYFSEYFSSDVIIEIHGSDSELEAAETPVERSEVVRILPFNLSDVWNSGKQSDGKYEKGIYVHN